LEEQNILHFFFQEGTEPSSGVITSFASGNPTAQSSALLDSNTPNSTTGKRTSAPQNVGFIQTAITTTKASSNNVLTEAKAISITAETSKPSTDINKVLRLKDIPLPAVFEQMSPRSTSVSESEHANHSSKAVNKSKTGSSETTTHNSPTLEQSLTQSRLETQV
jgi:hypothetical protein